MPSFLPRRVSPQMFHDGLQATGLLENLQLPLRAGAVAQNAMNALDGVAASEIVHDIIHKFQNLERQIAHGNFDALAKINQLAVEAPTHGAPFIFFDQRARIEPEPKIFRVQPMQFHDMACVSAASVMESSARVGTSQIRNSSVPNIGCGRTSHQIFLALSMQCSSTSSLM